MHHHILIPVALDHETLLPRKLEMARALLAEGGRITLMTVLEDVPGFVSEFVTVKSENHLRTQVRTRLEAAAGDSTDIDVVIETGKPGIRVTQYAQAQGVDLIVVGSHHPGLQDYFLGSTAARVARRAPCSVFILR